MISGRLVGIIITLIIFYHSVYGAEHIDYTDEIQKKLNVVHMLCEKHQYLKAQRELEEIKTKYISEDPMSGLGYPESIRCQIKALEGQIEDKTGEFKSLRKFTGKVIDSMFGAHAGYFAVKGGKNKTVKEFDWDCGLIIEGEGSFLKEGSRVTVYYMPDQFDDRFNKARKVITYGKAKKKPGK